MVLLFVFACFFDLVLTPTYKPRISRLSNTDQLQRNTVLQTFKASNKLRITTTNNKLQIFRTNNNNQCNTDNQAYIKQTTNSKIPWSVKQDVQTFQAIIKRNNKYSGTKGLKMFKFQCKQAADLRMRDLTSKLGDKSLTSQTFLLYLCNLCNWVPILNTLCIRTKRKRY